MEEAKVKKVCVTGASGYIGSWIVKELLQRGYTVNATIRDPSDPRKTKHLTELEGAKERLHLFKANLNEQGSFDAAIAGCEGVFHTASPVVFNAKDPQAEVLDPAVKGTLNVLNSCKKYPTVRRVIFTSSLSTSMHTTTTLAPDVVIDETWFSDPEFCKGPDVMCYVLSKVLSEEAAFKFAKENNMNMVSINPGMVIGPMLQPTMNGSVASIFNLISGSEFYPNFVTVWVHIKDVVEAHIRAFEIPSANGRYVVGERALHYSEVLKILHDLYPNLKLPQKCMEVGSLGTESLPKRSFQVSNSKVKQSLGITEYIPFEVGLRDTIEDLRNKNFVQFDDPK